MIVVASGCTDGTEQIVEAWHLEDSRVVLIRQPERLGKSSALNAILDRARGEIIAFVNADGCLESGALAALLAPFTSNSSLVVSCGAPASGQSPRSPAGIIANLQWELHNRTLEALSQRSLPNHCCDELMAIRRGFVREVPSDLVNDGAYLGTLASLRGVSVHFCPEARVVVETPSSLRGILAQRRRILRGHDQVRDLLGHGSNTLENLFSERPLLALTIIGQQILSRPQAFLAFLTLLAPVEFIAKFLTLWDRVREIRPNPAWIPVQ